MPTTDHRFTLIADRHIIWGIFGFWMIWMLFNRIEQNRLIDDDDDDDDKDKDDDGTHTTFISLIFGVDCSWMHWSGSKISELYEFLSFSIIISFGRFSIIQLNEMKGYIPRRMVITLPIPTFAAFLANVSFLWFFLHFLSSWIKLLWASTTALHIILRWAITHTLSHTPTLVLPAFAHSLLWAFFLSFCHLGLWFCHSGWFRGAYFLYCCCWLLSAVSRNLWKPQCPDKNPFLCCDDGQTVAPTSPAPYLPPTPHTYTSPP